MILPANSHGSDASDEPDDSDRTAESAEQNAWLDDEFPLGDGVAEGSSTVLCPYCGEENEIALDPGSGGDQEYVEDCQVCCQPWHVIVHYLSDGSADVTVTPADGN